jgi:two-component system OmpR family sensor kinase
MKPTNDDSTNLLLQALQRLLAIPGADIENSLNEACNTIGDGLSADKVDAFLYDESRDCLVALGTSSTPLSSLQKKLGLDVLQVSNGGRVVYVFQTGKTFVTGNLQEDPDELRGVKNGLKIQSKVGVALNIGGKRRGMIMIASLQPDFFDQTAVEFAESVTQWVAVVIHRAELIQEITRNAVEQGRRTVAEELITVLAHDLRNYLTPLYTRLQIIRKRAQDDDRADDVKDAGLGLGAMSNLKRLISDILDVAKLDNGIFQLDIQPVDLAETVDDVSKVLSTPEHNVVVHTAEHTIVAADPQRLRQCLENLIANAVQHSPHSAPAQVVVHTDQLNEKLWGTVEIQNEGPGIPAEFMPRIFDRYVSGPDSQGLGLGLYLAKRIAVAHGGELSVESPPGKGTRFRLHLPCYESAA